MRFVPLASVSMLLLLAAPARSATTTLGTSFGVQFISSPGASTVTILGIPSSPGIFFSGVQPGLHVGGLTDSGSEEIFLDMGWSLASLNGESIYSILNTLNYQHNFGTPGTQPYLTVGGGMLVQGYLGSSDSYGMLGGGVGLRNLVASGHGDVRFEFRYDRVFSSDALGEDLNVIGIKAGFDLLLR
jgi:hypothetical protein